MISTPATLYSVPGVDEMYLRDRLDNRALGALLSDMEKAEPQRFVKIASSARDPRWRIYPLRNYQKDTTLPANQTLVDRRALKNLKEAAKERDELRVENLRLQQELAAMRAQLDIVDEQRRLARN